MLANFEFKDKSEVISPVESYERWESATDKEWEDFMNHLTLYENMFDGYIENDPEICIQKGVYLMDTNWVQSFVSSKVSSFFIVDMITEYKTIGKFLQNETWYNDNFPSEYGMCDSVEQFMEKYESVLEDNKYKWTVVFMPILVEYEGQYRKSGDHINGGGWDVGDELYMYHVYLHIE